MENITVSCPYCGKIVQTDINAQNWAKNVSEILTVPVIERLGSLATTTTWVSKGKDPRVGGLMSLWNNTVGLLRGYRLDVNVMKRELRCDLPHCGSAFDCYANLDPQHSFADFWPHLTGKVDEAGQFSGSGARSTAEKLIAFGEKMGIDPTAFIVILAVIFCFITLVPYLLFKIPTSTLLEQAILRGSATVLAAFMIWTIRQTSAHVRGSFAALGDVLVVPNHNSIQFWHNFTLGRVTGVSFPKEAKSETNRKTISLRGLFSKLTVSQASIVGGIPSVVIAIIIWATNYLPHVDKFDLNILCELVFWLVIMYFSGISAWIGLNVGVFLLQNIAIIPMKLTPLNGFDNLAPIKRIAKLSLQLVIPVALLPLVFVIILLSLPGLHDLIQLWLLPWGRTFLGLGLLLIGLGDTGILVLGIVYIGLVGLLSSIPSAPLTGLALGSDQWIGLGVFGTFLSILLGYHFTRAFIPLSRIVKEKKQQTIDQLNRFLVSLSEELNKIDRNLSDLSIVEASRRDTLLRDIKNLVDLRDKVKATKVGIFDIQSGVGIVTPFVSSVVIPFALDMLKTKIPPTP